MDHFSLSSEDIGFRLFTRESLATIEKRIAEKKTEQVKAKLQNRVQQAEVEKRQPRPYLRACKKLPALFGNPPLELIGEPLEDLDPYYSDHKTFMVLNKKKTIFRFTATRALCIFSPFHPIRRAAIKVFVHPWFTAFIMFTVLLNCIVMIQKDFLENNKTIEFTFTGIYTCEILIKVLASGFVWNQFTFLRDPWNIVDLIVTVIMYVNLCLRKKNVPFLRIFRLLRFLKVISVIPELKVVVDALFLSIKKLADVMILTVFCLSVFALVGLQLFMGNLKMKCVRNNTIFDEKLCDVPKISYVNESDICYRMNNSQDILLCGWKPDKKCPENYSCQKIGDNPDFGYTSFDHFGWAFLSVFRLMTQDNWERLYRQTIRTSGKTYVIFFVVVIFLCSFYLFNLILAVVIMAYEEQNNATLAETQAKKKLCQEAEELLRKEQEQISADSVNNPVQRQRIMSATNIIADAKKSKWKCPSCWNRFAQKYLIWDCYPLWIQFKEKLKLIVMDPFADLTVTVCIVVNTIFMALEHHKMSEALRNMIFTANYVFTGIFTAEMIFKIIALDPYYYFQQGWNIFDSIIVMIGLISIIRKKNLAFFRLLRIFKLSRSWQALNKLVKIMYLSVGALGSLQLVLCITIFIFALVGRQVFGEHYSNFTKISTDCNLRWHMNDFFHSFLIIFRILCGEWIETLWSCMKVAEKQSCLPFFLLVLMVGKLVVLNLFIALLVNSWNIDDPATPDAAENRTKLQLAFSRIHMGLQFVIQMTGDLCCKILRQGLKTMTSRKVMVKVTTQNLGGNDHAAIDMGENYTDNGIYQNKEKSPMAKDYEDFLTNSNTFVCVPLAEAECYSEDYDDENSTYTKMEYTAMQENELKHRREKQKSSGVLSQASETSDTISVFSTSTQKEKQTEELAGIILSTEKLDEPKDCLTEGCVQCSLCCAVDITKFPGSTWWRFRKTCYRIVQNSWFETFIIFIILLSSATLAFEDIYLQEHPTIQNLLKLADKIFAYIFLLEMFLKWVAYGFQKYFTNVWCLLDFFIVCVSLVNVSNEEEFKRTELCATLNIKSFRTLRALRPLRALSRLEGIKVVVYALVGAIPSIMNVMLVCLVVWLPFNIFGVKEFCGKFWKCTPLSSDLIDQINNRNDCEIHSHRQSLKWENAKVNFDHVGMGYLALLQVATFKGWMDIMYAAVDSREVDQQPKYEHRLYMYLYFVCFIMIGSFFMLNLFVGVVIKNFNEQREKISGDHLFLTKEQKKYYNALKKLGSKKPQKPIPRPLNKYQGFFFDIVSSKAFEITIVTLICLNMIILMLTSEDQDEKTRDILDIINKVFVAIFTGECIMKILALRHYFFTDCWNRFDLLVVILSLVGVGVDVVLKSPSLLRIVRLVRVCRILRLIRQAQRIRTLLFTLLMSLPALFNIGLLLFLIMYIYAILGMAFFAYTDLDDKIDDIFNFQTFGGSMLCLFQITTSAGWHDLLNHFLGTRSDSRTPNLNIQRTNDTSCVPSSVAIIYFVSYIIISFLIVINLYIAVILENLNVATEESREPLCEDDFDMFYEIWGKFDSEATQFIEYSALSDFADALEKPLRVSKPNKIQLIAMDLPLFSGDRIYYWDILLAFIKRVLGESGEMDKLMMENKLKIAIPSKLAYKPITTTLRRRREELSAIIIQRAFRSYLIQCSMKQGSFSYQHRTCDSSIFEEDVSEKESSQSDKSQTASSISFPPSYDSVAEATNDNLQVTITESSKAN
ncbi:LOW QUALITY PROTEIN: sodium channel protein type 5 subunit alpha-like [Gopherus flavomarginatus]|uniref:LOW QUALITY PROTEIN: sodium channel protein type 5 subunit alpha-like n=1 Tax=Gopherus flavomarginatus TaxID=286002 RepID=UPI0021CBC21A|nr:LOW QUALITY PROTEIN: sodium channel protein type 5 subunit alpha-like [Gopherus flavomarginatus]